MVCCAVWLAMMIDRIRLALDGLDGLEVAAVGLVAKVAPWLAPVPSAYFVVRSSVHHLAVPLWVAVVIGAIIELLGLTTVHSALWAYEWNLKRNKRQDAPAPLVLPVAMGVLYLAITVGLIVVLEVFPWLSTYAPGLFPFLSIVGTVNLAFVARQRKREEDRAERLEAARKERQERRQVRSSNGKEPLTFREMTERYNLVEMDTATIARLSRRTERTARNWKRKAAE